MADVRRCQITIRKFPCFEIAEAFYDAGCEHEHVTSDIGICAEHVEVITGDPWTCQVCEQADGHKCPVAIREVTRA